MLNLMTLNKLIRVYLEDDFVDLCIKSMHIYQVDEVNHHMQ